MWPSAQRLAVQNVVVRQQRQQAAEVQVRALHTDCLELQGEGHCENWPSALLLQQPVKPWVQLAACEVLA